MPVGANSAPGRLRKSAWLLVAGDRAFERGEGPDLLPVDVAAATGSIGWAAGQFVVVAVARVLEALARVGVAVAAAAARQERLNFVRLREALRGPARDSAATEVGDTVGRLPAGRTRSALRAAGTGAAWRAEALVRAAGRVDASARATVVAWEAALRDVGASQGRTDRTGILEDWIPSWPTWGIASPRARSDRGIGGRAHACSAAIERTARGGVGEGQRRALAREKRRGLVLGADGPTARAGRAADVRVREACATRRNAALQARDLDRLRCTIGAASVRRLRAAAAAERLGTAEDEHADPARPSEANGPTPHVELRGDHADPSKQRDVFRLDTSAVTNA